MNEPSSDSVAFAENVREVFRFLCDQGFVETVALPSVVEFVRGGVTVDIYCGRKSQEIGAGITFLGSRYALSEIVRAVDPEVANRMRNIVATTPELMTKGLEELGSALRQYGASALHGKPSFFSALSEQRSRRSEDYALDVLASQLRPQAEEAFRCGEYAKAAEAYARIRGALSPAEIKKLEFAERRLNR